MHENQPTFAKRLYWSAYLGKQLQGQARFPFQSPEAIERAQRRRLRPMVAHAYAAVPYYRETMQRLGLRPDDFRTADDVAKLPVLERAQVQRDPDYYCTSATPREHCLPLRSSGSSGAPGVIYHAPSAIFQNAAHAERERSILTALVGRRLGYREAVLASPGGVVSRVQAFLRRNVLAPRGTRIERCYISLAEPPAEAARQLNAFKPDIVQGYGSYFEMLFGHLQQTATTIHRPAAITYSSDGMSESARRLTVDRFGIPVFSTYQATEALKIGFECEEHRGLHLNIDLYPLRIVDGDGQTVPDGVSGDVVISNLVNRATVLLNYRLGDVARRLTEPCVCGRTLPLLSWPEGRRDDVLTLAHGRQVHPQAIAAIFRDEREIWQYQVVQESVERLRIALVPAEHCDQAATRARLTANVAHICGEEIAVTISFVDDVERTAAGKARAVIARAGQQAEASAS